MELKSGQPIIAFASQAEFAAWMSGRHAESDGLWLKIAKKGSGIPTVTYAEALDVAICHGWIDSQKAAYDDRYFLQRFTPRRPRGKWSKINREKAEQLIAAGAMKPAGLREVEQAKVDGRWEAAYDSQRTAAVPGDLQDALDANPAAAAFFATLNSANRYAILYRVHEAKRPETRARRIERFVAMLAGGKALYS